MVLGPGHSVGVRVLFSPRPFLTYFLTVSFSMNLVAILYSRLKKGSMSVRLQKQ